MGACVVNDDWGFKTQTMFPPEMMEEYVFPYTRKIVEVIHANGKPAILHSCGNVKDIMGGIDVDFLARKTPEEIYERSLPLLEKTSGTGGFALGSGNSIPDFVSRNNSLPCSGLLWILYPSPFGPR